jgi:hypothetical protein
METSIWRQEGYMAPKPKPARLAYVFGMVLAVAAIILAITTRNLAAPSSSPIYHPQLVLLY